MDEREIIITPDGFRVASRPETLVRRRRDRLRAIIKKFHTPYKRIVPPYLRGKVRGAFIIIAIAAIAAFQFLYAKEPPLTVYFYDIGQGDAIHIRTSEGFDVLIDGGPTGRVAEKLGRTLPFWDHTIELMVLTHPHADHLVGFIEILKQFKVEKVLATGVVHTTDEYLMWLDEIKRQGIKMETARAGQRWVLGRPAAPVHAKTAVDCPSEAITACARPRSSASAEVSAEADTVLASPAQHFCCEPPPPDDLADDSALLGGEEEEKAVLEILWPKESYEGKRVVEKSEADGGLNATSIVSKLTYGKTSFLFTGDMEEGVETQLLEEYNANIRISCQSTNTNSQFVDLNKICRFALQADVLKVGHHGSKTSTSKEFLEVVQPKYAVIQVGKNRYGHPAFATLWRLKQAGVEILRNDTDGDVVFEGDGKMLQYRTAK